MNNFSTILSYRDGEPYMSPDEMVEYIKNHLYDRNGSELYRYACKLLDWIKNNYNVEPTDYNVGYADGSISFSTTTSQESKNINNIIGGI